MTPVDSAIADRLGDDRIGDDRIALGWCGPAEHGIPLTARRIAGAAGALGFAGHALAESDPTRLNKLVSRLPSGVRLLHLHVNDWLFADSSADPDQQIAALGVLLHSRGVALSVTLHDLPQLSDGSKLYARRVGTYRQLVDLSVGVVVSSEHERTLLREALDDTDLPVEVIPLPIDPLPPADGPARQHIGSAQTIGIFGYLYPGKGHLEVLQELAGMKPPVHVVAIGRPSDRHTELVGELTKVAVDGGNTFHCSGFVPDADLPNRLREVAVPLAPHTHISASGSINSWIAAGRRPLVPAGRYVTELEQRLPGSVWIYQPGELRATISAAVGQPENTVLPADFPVGPTTDLVAGRYLTWLRQLERSC
ncbi:MAG: hypothetical protein ABWZ98_01695 [Nakamurella sp.]